MAPSVDLPFDVVENILSRLPAKSVARFKSVCKSWKAIIYSDRFSQLRSMNRRPRINLKGQRYNRFVELFGGIIWMYRLNGATLENGDLEEENTLGDTLPYPAPVSSFNGIVVLHSHRGSVNCITLWNPTLGKVTTLRCPIFKQRETEDDDDLISSWFSCGLYYDDGDDDYRVAAMDSDSHYSVFSFKSGKWVRKESVQLSLKQRKGSPVFHDGSFYFYRWPDGHGAAGAVVAVPEIEYFDAREHRWKTLQKPNGLIPGDTLTVLSGRLCLYRISFLDVSFKVWVMEEEEEEEGKWKRQWREMDLIDQDLQRGDVFEALYAMDREGLEAMCFPTPVCLTEWGNNVVLHGFCNRGFSHRFFVYNAHNNRFESAIDPWSRSSVTDTRGYKFIAYSETMAFPVNPNNNNNKSTKRKGKRKTI